MKTNVYQNNESLSINTKVKYTQDRADFQHTLSTMVSPSIQMTLRNSVMLYTRSLFSAMPLQMERR